MNGWQWFLAVFLILVCCFLMLIVLIQRGRGSGLTGAFGGAGGGSAFGAKTGDVLTWITVVVAGFFLFLAVVANYKFDQSPKPVVDGQLLEVPATPESDTGFSTGPITVQPIEIPIDSSEPDDRDEE